MIKLDIQNLPIEIIEDDTKFNETTYLFFLEKNLM